LAAASSTRLMPPVGEDRAALSPGDVDAAAAPRPGEENPVVLDVYELKTYFFTYDGVVKALDGVTFKMRKGETLGLVGETGCGKSVTAFSITRLIPDPPGRILSGTVVFRGADILWGLDREASFRPIKGTGRVKVKRSFRRIKAATERMASVRGRGISMIFQEPSQAMNPIFSISDQVSEAILLHRGTEVVELLLRADTAHLSDRVRPGGSAPAPSEPGAEAPSAPAPDLSDAIDRLVQVARDNDRSACLAAADEIARRSEVPSIGTEAYYTARELGPLVSDSGEQIRQLFQRFRLTGLQRSFLRHELRRLKLQEELNSVYIDEMRSRAAHAAARRSVTRRLTVHRLRGFHFGLWGIRRHVRRPMVSEAFWRTVELLEGVAIANPVQVARGYPHELSGGMIQRVMIAMSLSADPDVLIADEPTTALDVTIQAQILEIFRNLKARIGTSILLITHDLAVIAEVAERVCVMYAGLIVETAPVEELYRRPLHPYSQGLLASIPRVDQPEKQLSSIPGSVPNLINPPGGCRFHPRCPYAMPICKEIRPPTTVEGERHTVACYLYKGPVAVE
jgi:peptide/nickel transport system ATP-binding protein